MNIVFYPVFSDRETLTDHYYRLHWYLYPFMDKIDQIILLHTLEGYPIGDLPDYLDTYLVELTRRFPNVRLVKMDGGSFPADIAKKAHYVFLWRSDPARPGRIPESEVSSIIAKKTIIRVDHDKEQFAGSFYLRFAEQFPKDIRANTKASQRVFKRIVDRCRSDIGYIFGTGPGLSCANDHDFSDGVCIACNSMVKNHALLERLRPPLIVVGDPIFHAGPSSYAAAFRAELIRAMDRHDADLIVPMRDYHVYKAHLPERFADRIAGVPFKPGDVPNLDLEKSFYVTTTGNVLTLFLLPLAATLFKEVRIFGCDGRPMEDNRYFWKHDKTSQFNDEMENIKRAHPAFFNIDYNDYYLKHINTVEKWLSYMEKKGLNIVNLSPSHIPALQKRSKKDIKNYGKAANNARSKVLVMIDPDIGDAVGHFLPMADRIYEQAQQNNYQCICFSHKAFSGTSEKREYIYPLFNVHSWDIYDRGSNKNYKSLNKFRDSVKKVALYIKEKYKDMDIYVFMYSGDFNASKILFEELGHINGIHIRVNMLWLSFVNYKNKSYVKKWLPFIREFLSKKENMLFATTQQLSKGIEEAFHISVPVIPHVIPTYSDREAFYKLDELEKTLKDIKSPNRFRIMFPAMNKEAKGSLIISDIINTILKYNYDYTIIVRGGDYNIDYSNPNIILTSDVLDDKEYREFLQSGDIAVLPYQSETFSDRPSGLFLDLIYNGIPVVTTPGTWIADFISEYGGGIVVSSFEVESIIYGIEAAKNNYPSLKIEAIKAAKRWSRSNNWRAFFYVIVGNIDNFKQKVNHIKETHSSNNTQSINYKANGVQSAVRKAMISDLTLYARFAEWLKMKSPPLFRIGQFVMAGLRALKRRPAFTLAMLLLLAALVVPPFLWTLPPVVNWLMWGAAAALVLGGALIWGVHFAESRLKLFYEHRAAMERNRHRQQVAQLQSEISTLKNLVSQLRGDADKTRQDLMAGLKKQAEEEKASLARLEQRLEERVKALREEERAGRDKQAEELRKEIANLQRLVDKTQSETDKLRQELNEAGATVAKRLQEEERALAELEQRLEERVKALREEERAGRDKQAEELRAEIATLSQMIEELRGAADQVRQDLAEELARRLRGNDAALGELAARMERQLDELRREEREALEKARADLSGKMADIATTANSALEAAHSLVKAAPVFNYGRFQSFNRTLGEEQAAHLVNDWGRKLNLKITPKGVYYLAHRVCMLESMLKGRIAASIEDIVLRILVATSVKKRKLHVMEIGTLFGIGLAAIHDYAKGRYEEVKLMAIDPLEGYYGDNARDVLTDVPVNETVFRENMAAAQVPEKDVTLLKGMSTDEDIIASAAQTGCDVLIIDGDHSYAGVKADFVNYAPMVKRGGYIIFDDYDAQDWPDVVRFVDEVAADHPALAHVGSSWRTAVYRVVRKVQT